FLFSGLISLVSYGQFFVQMFSNSAMDVNFNGLEGSMNFMLYANIINLFLSIFSYLILAFIINKIHSFEVTWNQQQQGTL
ncbi:MAG: hypothetical protein ACPGED_10545, partial [Flavobacteriales bacterium]